MKEYEQRETMRNVAKHIRKVKAFNKIIKILSYTAAAIFYILSLILFIQSIVNEDLSALFSGIFVCAIGALFSFIPEWVE